MSSEFWIGMAVSAILGLLGNVFANLYHAKIASFLNTRKSIFLEKNKAKTLREYRLVADFKERRKDWHDYLIRMMAIYVAAVVVAFTLLSAALIIITISPDFPDMPPSFDLLLTQPYRRMYTGIAALFLLSFAMTFLAASIGRQARIIASALENFSSYKEALEAKWGPIEHPSPSLGDE